MKSVDGNATFRHHHSPGFQHKYSETLSFPFAVQFRSADGVASPGLPAGFLRLPYFSQYTNPTVRAWYPSNAGMYGQAGILAEAKS
jgi:hypothetical protein